MNRLHQERLQAFQIAGIDLSTQAVDIVLLDYDDGHAHWRRFPLDGPGAGFHRALNAFHRIRHSNMWENVEIVVIEEPAGNNHRTAFLLGMVAGGTLATVPRDIVVNYLNPAVWRPKFHTPLRGKDRKAKVRARAIQLGFDPGPATPDDAYEAFALAWVMREENAASVARATEWPA